MSSTTRKIVSGSFRDPSGFVFRDERGVLLRQINRVYEKNYRWLMDSGLYRNLVADDLLIEHDEVEVERRLTDQAFAVIRPRDIGFVSYPYEWPFSALKDAALLTLAIQRRAMEFGMSLKDASAFNIQFTRGRPVFIDTLSFERYTDGKPWVAYSQFCRHFLAPLALMAGTDIELGRLFLLDVDGVPLKLASRLLPWRSWFHFGLLTHLHAQAWMIDRYSKTGDGKPASTKAVRLSRDRLLVFINNLERTVNKMRWIAPKTEWADYYQANSYSDDEAKQKERIVSQYLQQCEPATVWDLGANTGKYSRLATMMGAATVAFDIDPACVEAHYLSSKENNDSCMLTLRQDLTNPSPPIGWAHKERKSLADRGPVDVVMALALIHHLAIGNNLPCVMIAEFLARLGRHLIIEFVPKTDPQVQRLLRSREDIFPDYTQANFEAAFRQFFVVLEATGVGRDGRIVFLMERCREYPKRAQAERRLVCQLTKDI